jgi:hypothetical protein
VEVGNDLFVEGIDSHEYLLSLQIQNI